MPLLLHSENPLWGVWKIEENVDELLSYLILSPEDIAFVESKATENRKKEWLATRVLVKKLLNIELQIGHYPNGAPYLENSSRYISISHTRGYVAVILHEKYPVGIDIEYKSERVRKIRSRFMSPREEEGVNLQHETNHLLLYWCAKETLFKVIGEENVDFKENLHIESFDYHVSGIFTGYETRTGFNKRYSITYLVTDPFVLTYTIEEESENFL